MFVGTVKVTAREVSESQLLAYCVVKINQDIEIEGIRRGNLSTIVECLTTTLKSMSVKLGFTTKH